MIHDRTRKFQARFTPANTLSDCTNLQGLQILQVLPYPFSLSSLISLKDLCSLSMVDRGWYAWVNLCELRVAIKRIVESQRNSLQKGWVITKSDLPWRMFVDIRTHFASYEKESGPSPQFVGTECSLLFQRFIEDRRLALESITVSNVIKQSSWISSGPARSWLPGFLCTLCAGSTYSGIAKCRGKWPFSEHENSITLYFHRPDGFEVLCIVRSHRKEA